MCCVLSCVVVLCRVVRCDELWLRVMRWRRGGVVVGVVMWSGVVLFGVRCHAVPRSVVVCSVLRCEVVCGVC